MNRAQNRAQWRNRIRREAGNWRSPHLPQVRMAALLPKLNSTHVRVNELVFRGFESPSPWRIASAFEQELTVLLQTHSLPAQWHGNVAQAHTASLRLHSLTDTRRIGEQLAHAVFALKADNRQPGMKK